MRTIILIALAAAGLAVAGCAPTADPLTQQERLQQLVEMNRQLELQLQERDRTVAELSGGQTGATRNTAADPAVVAAPAARPATLEDPFEAIDITFGRLTGGIDIDGKAGHDGLRVIIQPHDKSGDVVKRAGSLRLDLYDLALAGQSQQIAHWEFTANQLVNEWAGRFGINSYALELRWPNGQPPAHSNLTLKAAFTTVDGRRLEAQTNFNVKLPGSPEAAATAPVTAPPAPATAPAPAPTPAPAPAPAAEIAPSTPAATDVPAPPGPTPATGPAGG